MFYHILWYSCKNVTKGSSFREDVCIFWRPAHLGFSDVLSYFIIFLKNITKGLSFREDVCTFSFIILAKCHVSHKLCSMYSKLCSVYSKSCSIYSILEIGLTYLAWRAIMLKIIKWKLNAQSRRAWFLEIWFEFCSINALQVVSDRERHFSSDSS